MLKPSTLALSALLLATTAVNAQTIRPYSLLNPDALADLKAKTAANDAALTPALTALREKADKLLTEKPPSVMEKPDPLPVPGDRHDYMSLARYFWPNPNTPDGLPYVQRDGDSNTKGIALYDTFRKDKMCFAVRDLALAYHLTGDEKYAAGAAKYLRTWFLDEATKMNPNLNHGQFVPGVTPGRGYGIIETRWFVFLTDAVRLLENSPSWPKEDNDAFKAWMTQYVDWLQTSKLGLEEYNTKNNHGQWYDAQLIGLANYLGRTDIINKIAAEEGPKRIAKQVQPDGSLPEEIRRTRSLHYSLFAIEPWMQIARIAKANNAPTDLHNWKTEDNRSIKQALLYLTPYLLGEQEWTHQQLGDKNYSGYAGMFQEAGVLYSEPRFLQVAAKLKPAPDANNLHEQLGW